MDSCKKFIIGYQVSDPQAADPFILAMHMDFDNFKNFP